MQQANIGPRFAEGTKVRIIHHELPKHIGRFGYAYVAPTHILTPYEHVYWVVPQPVRGKLNPDEALVCKESEIESVETD